MDLVISTVLESKILNEQRKEEKKQHENSSSFFLGAIKTGTFVIADFYLSEVSIGRLKD